MQEYTIHRSNRRCHRTDRAIGPGECYYSAVVAQGSSLVRQDFATEAWAEPPAGTVGWWTGRVPQKNPGKPKPAPAHVLLATLEVLLEDPAKSELAYLLSLLLIRRRILVEPSKIPIDEQEEATAEGEDSEEESPLLHLTHPPSNRDFVVPKSIIDLQQSQALQEELNQLLFSES